MNNTSSRTPASGSDEEARTRSQLLVEHIAIYGLTLTPIVCRLFCDGSASKTKNAFRKLHEHKRIVSYTLSKAHGTKYHVLSADEVKRRTQRGATGGGRLSGASIHSAVAVLCFCHAMPEAVRRRMPFEKLVSVLPFSPLGKRASYVLETKPEEYIGRCIVPSLKANPSYAVKLISKDSQRLMRDPKARPLLAHGQYRYVVLVSSEPRKKLFSEAIELAKSRREIAPETSADVVCVPEPSMPSTEVQP